MPTALRELDNVRAVVFDLDGVLYQQHQPLAGAVETVRTLKQNAVPVRFLTNTNTRGRHSIASKLRALGFSVETEEVFCPPFAAGTYLRQQDVSAYLLVRDAALEALIFGKPEPAIFDAVLASLGYEAMQVAMVGADIHTDVGAAMAAGWRGVLVKTGKYRPADLAAGIEPHLVVESVADLVAF